MERLASDPEAYRSRKKMAESSMAEILADPPRQAVIQAEVVLDGTLAPAYQIARTIFESMTDQGEREFVTYLIASAVMAEMSKLAAVRNRLMDMGSVEALAASDGLQLSTSDRAVAAEESDVVAKADVPLVDHYRKGYVSTRCPNCRKRAIWHPDRHDLLCLDGCGPIGKFEERPGPDATIEDR